MEHELHTTPSTPEKVWATLDRITAIQEKSSERLDKLIAETDQWREQAE